jgi:hypothetical protein
MEQRPGGGILPSNVDSLEAAEAPRRKPRRNIVVPILCLLVAAGLGALVMLLFTTSQTPPPRPVVAQPTSAPAATNPATPQTQSQAQTQPQAQGQTARQPRAVSAPLPINGISCDALESTIFHIHVHLAVFFDQDEQAIPFGIGIGEPWQVENSPAGPFVVDGLCFYWIHTHTEDGVVHIESPVRRTFTLGDFFAIWEQPLSATQVGPKQGQVIAYVNGDKVTTHPEDIPLLQHAQIQLDVGADVPPYSFDFPPGD